MGAHMATYNRQITDVTEFAMRVENYTQIHNFINEHNASGANWVAGHNQFSDWSFAEYKAMLGYTGTRDAVKEATIFEESNATEVNWITGGAVTPVKGQGQCGSCWAFSTVASLEGAHFIAKGELLSFSEQQLVDCAGLSSGYGNHGCKGGLQQYGYKYYEDGHKAELESVYTYFSGTTGKKGKCMYDSASTTAVTVTDFLGVTADDQTQMKAALTKQPLAVSIEADKRIFQTYKSGGLDSWLVKNSWNTTWGDAGYIKLARVDGKGICGVQMTPWAPTSN